MGSSASKSRFESWPQFLDLDKEADMTEPVAAEVTGRFPHWVQGSLYRNGCGVYKMGNDQYRHLFDGFAVIHRWSIKNGEVTYRSSILDSSRYKKCVKYDRLIGDSFASTFPDPCKTLLERFFTYFVPKPSKRDNCAVNIVQHGDKLFALTETNLVVQVDGDEMKLERTLDLGEMISVHIGTAHPHFDTEGNMYYYATNPRDPTKSYNFIKVPPPAEGETPFAKGEVIATLGSRWKFHYGYTHSFGMSENYIIHAELPTALSVAKLITKGMTGAAYAECAVPYLDEGINIVLANRKTGERVPVTYLAPFGFVFHFVNCYEEKGHLIVDVFFWDEKDAIGALYLDSIMERMSEKKDFRVLFARFVLPLDIDEAKSGENLVTLPDSQATAVLRPGEGKVLDLTPDFIFDEPEKYYGELPRFNYDYNTKKYRYCYSCTTVTAGHGKLHKHDLEAKKVTEWVAGDDYTTGEPVFLKDPKGTAEDDGVILSPVVANTTEKPSFLICLDASTFKELGRATVPSDIKMNVTFHGDFYKRFN